MLSKPNYIEQFGTHFLYWFEKSNTYSCVDEQFHQLLTSYFNCRSELEFIGQISLEFHLDKQTSALQFSRIENYLKSCNTVIYPSGSWKTIPFKTSIEGRVTSYKVGSKSIQVKVNDHRLLDIIHPIFSHLESKPLMGADLKLAILLQDDVIGLVVNNSKVLEVNKNEYHKLQGKIVMLFINLLHNKAENDWIGLLHASAVELNNSGLVIFGSSGSGKSTLISLLVANGFGLIADDLVPVLSTNHQLYSNPSAISIKHPSLEVVKPYWPDISAYSKAIVTKGKGDVTYIPVDNTFKTEVGCQTLLKVNYNCSSSTQLKPLNIKEALDILIPESWLNSNPENAKSFLNWLKTIRFYELTYSNYKEVIPLLKNLLKT